MSDWVEVQIEEVRAAGSAMLRTGDDVGAIGGAPPLEGRGTYGHDALAAAATRFADRYGHFVRSQGRQLVDAGEVLRSTAASYEDADTLAPARFVELANDLPAGTELM